MPCYYPVRLPGVPTRVPCGRCVGCSLEYSRVWGIRCVKEAMDHRDNSFLTLTYRNENLPHTTFLDTETGEFKQSVTLLPRDLQKFWKRLRKRFKSGTDGTDIRYFAAGEFGDKTKRPHYHAALFGIDFPDKIPWKKTAAGLLYRSKILEEIWTHGDCLIGDVTFDSAAYIARYMVEKKLKGKYMRLNDGTIEIQEDLEREFMVCSRRPGIGGKHFDSYYRDYFPLDLCSINGKFCKPPRYYTERLKKHNIDMYNSVKLSRLNNKINIVDNLPRRLAQRERVAIGKMSQKMRSLELD